jgi:L-lactate dehydrogenase
MVIGEHGTTEVLLWSSATVAGVPVEQAYQEANQPFAKLREDVERDVRYANITIIEGNDASQYGIGIVCARLTEAVLRDERTIFPVASYQQAYGVTLSLPSVVGRAGVIRTLEPTMSQDERAALEHSAEQLKTAADHLQIRAM